MPRLAHRRILARLILIGSRIGFSILPIVHDGDGKTIGKAPLPPRLRRASKRSRPAVWITLSTAGRIIGGDGGHRIMARPCHPPCSGNAWESMPESPPPQMAKCGEAIQFDR
ncbi:MAG: hypothetical protein ACM3JG_12255 [Thiohalocapsa sp.]